MSEKLLESDFLTIDLSSIFRNQTTAPKTSAAADSSATAESETGTSDAPATSAPITDWGQELKNRLKANKELSRESRQTEFDIESQFFKEYFTEKWKDPAVAKQLMSLGAPLKKALKTLGFNKKLNPILAFLKIDYVQTELLKTKLLNINTFKAIYQAVAKRLVADSEFMRKNDYNIIYCRDLYKKPLTEMLGYLTLQKSILSPSGTTYTITDQQKNKKVFLRVNFGSQDPDKYIAFINKLDGKALLSVQDPKAKLNDIKQADDLADKIGEVKRDKENKTLLDSKEMQSLADKLDTHAKILAALQALSLSTDSAEAKKAMTNDAFGRVDMKNLLKATAQIAPIMPRGPLSEKDTKALVSILLSKV